MKDAILISACSARSAEIRRIAPFVLAAAVDRRVILSSCAWQVLGPLLDGVEVQHYEGPVVRRIALGGVALAIVLRDAEEANEAIPLVRACVSHRTRLAVCADGAIAMLEHLTPVRVPAVA